MKQKITKCLLCILIWVGCAGCHKEENSSPLAGTSWECIEEPEMLVFNDNSSGILYCKGATDGVYDDIYSSYDFTYEVSGKDVTIRVFFSNFDSLYNYVIEDDETLTCGRFRYKKIRHK